MITCREVVEFLSDFIANELPAEQHARVERHLQLCPSCVAYVASYRVTVQVTRQLPRFPLPPHLRQRLHALLDENGTDQGTHPGERRRNGDDSGD
jgi:anti-sigma factor RsiW